MSEAERRIGYSPTRILIETERILDPQFYAQGVYLSGAQVEMLRNITAYLNMRATYVDTYGGVYYLMPDDGDWAEISAIVADLEDKLMNNDNLPFGYNAGWVGSLAALSGGGGTQTVTLDPVGAGEVLRLEGISWYNNTGARGIIQAYVKRGTESTQIAYIQTPATKEPILWTGVITLEEDDRVVVKQFSVSPGDSFVGAAWGYKMIVPE